MRLRVATWNINSVRLRHDQVARFVAETGPDVVCLQETKCREGEFPVQAFVDMGLPYLKIKGQKGWHGVAIASRLPIGEAAPLDVCREGHARCVSGVIAGVELQNFYIPAGGDVPDRAINPKFDHKLDFYEKLSAAMALRDPMAPLLIAGDLNVAPGENDVWNHRHMLKIVSHTPAEIEAMGRLQASLGLVDVVRAAFRTPRSCSPGGAIAPPTSAPPTAACAWITCWPPPASPPPAPSRRRCMTTCANGSGHRTMRPCRWTWLFRANAAASALSRSPSTTLGGCAPRARAGRGMSRCDYDARFRRRPQSDLRKCRLWLMKMTPAFQRLVGNAFNPT